MVCACVCVCVRVCVRARVCVDMCVGTHIDMGVGMRMFILFINRHMCRCVDRHVHGNIDILREVWLWLVYRGSARHVDGHGYRHVYRCVHR